MLSFTDKDRQKEIMASVGMNPEKHGLYRFLWTSAAVAAPAAT